jgi:ribonuclease HI
MRVDVAGTIIGQIPLLLHPLMKKTKSKYYVVWQGHTAGIYDSWDKCKKQVDGYAAAKYKSFDTLEEANRAFSSNAWAYLGKNVKPAVNKELLIKHGQPIKEALCVDAACSGNPGILEYRGVYPATGQEIFRRGPFPEGTNNIGEFLAIVTGLAWLKKNNISLPLYSDSRNAISWVEQKSCKTKLPRNKKNEELFDLVDRAEEWLMNNSFSTRILKWETKAWGEIPADFGRK